MICCDTRRCTLRYCTVYRIQVEVSQLLWYKRELECYSSAARETRMQQPKAYTNDHRARKGIDSYFLIFLGRKRFMNIAITKLRFQIYQCVSPVEWPRMSEAATASACASSRGALPVRDWEESCSTSREFHPRISLKLMQVEWLFIAHSKPFYWTLLNIIKL